MPEAWFNYYEVRLYVATPQIGGEGGGDTWTYDRTDIQTFLI